MDTIDQIKQICAETDNDWFLTHYFTTIALYDLELMEELKKENIFNFDERTCVCKEGIGCKRCDIEIDRTIYFDDLKMSKLGSNIYDYEEEIYIKSKWIIPDKIDGEIPGFILLRCYNNKINDEEFTHELVFACVRYKYRKNGVLKNMLSNIPKEWNIWLEANSKDIEDIENVWKKCGFTYYTTIKGSFFGDKIIYKRKN